MKFNRLNISRLLIGLVVMASGLWTSCGEGELNELPTTVQSFVAQYFPGVVVSDYSTDKDGDIHVALRNDATLVFDSDGDWIEVDGNGSPLPADLVLDRLPAPLYDYLESIEEVGNVYSIKKETSSIVVGLLDTTLTYDTLTQTVVYPPAKS